MREQIAKGLRRAEVNRNYSGMSWLLLVVAFALTGCRHTAPNYGQGTYADFEHGTPQSAAATNFNAVKLLNERDANWLKPPSDLFTLGPGDRVEIEILGEPGSKTTTVVAPDGKLYFNLLSGVDVWGATLAQARAAIEQGLAGYVKEKPQVSIILRGVESKRIWVLGRVQAPGVYSMAAPMSLLEAISMAGGTLSLSNYRDQEAAGIGEELADLSRSFVIRHGKMLPVDFKKLLKQGDLSQNIYLAPDDFVYLPAARSREVYVLGAVQQPRPVPYSEGLSVVGAVASAYGTIKGAYMHHIVVIRGSLSEPQVAVVDYKDVIRGQAKDIALQPYDIVYVPFSPYRYLWKYVELAVNTFVSASAINAGTRLVNEPTTGGAGVFIPVGSGVQIIPPVTPPPIR